MEQEGTRSFLLTAVPGDDSFIVPGGFWASIRKTSAVSFQSVMRLTVAEFEDTCQRIGPFLSPSRRGKPVQYGVGMHLAIFLMHVAYALPFRALGCMFDLGDEEEGKSSAYRIVHRTTEAILQGTKDVTKMPSREGLSRLAELHEREYGLRHVVGAVDCTHLRLMPRHDERVGAWNYKQFYSTNMLAVVDCSRRFLFTEVGRPGSVHDAFVATHCPLGRQQRDLAPENRPIPPPYVLVGDPAFRMTSWLVKGFGAGRGPQRRFDEALAAIRCCSERAFAHLKQNFKILSYSTRRDVRATVPFARACIKLHNIMIEHRTTGMDVDYEDDEDEDDNDDGGADGDGDAHGRGAQGPPAMPFPDPSESERRQGLRTQDAMYRAYMGIEQHD